MSEARGSCRSARSIPFLAGMLGCVCVPLACVTPAPHRPETAVQDLPWSAPRLEHGLSVRNTHSGQRIELEEMFDRLAEADVVFLGETHTDETTHRLELATYDALLARRNGRVVLALEMFERDVQPVLDEYVAGRMDEPAFLSQARPWPNYATAYRPMIERAKVKHSPVVASNFPAPLRRRMADGSADFFAGLSASERRNVPAELLPETPEYWKRVDNAIRGHLGMMGQKPAADDPRLDDTQSLWDNSMGESCARALDDHPGWSVLHVNGGFHSAYWDGTVHQLVLRKPNVRVMTVAIEPAGNPSTELVPGTPIADFVVFAEARAKDVDDGDYAVVVPHEQRYKLHVPESASAGAPVPLLIWLGNDGSNAKEGLDEWRERLGETCAIAAIEAPQRELQDDLVEGGRWYHSDSFSEDVDGIVEGVERTWAFVARHFPVDAARVCVAGEGTGATVASAIGLTSTRMNVQAVVLQPRQFAQIKDFSLPLPELHGDAPARATEIHVMVNAGDEDWWSSEIADYRGIGLQSELATATHDAWQIDFDRENAVRAALGLGARTLPPDAARKYIVASTPRARAWARRAALHRSFDPGELVAVVDAPSNDARAAEIGTAIHARDFRMPGALPLCPGAFGGTTVVVLPDGLPQDDVDGWLALQKDDPIAAQSRFNRLRVAVGSGEHALSTVLAQLLEKKRRNVLIAPAVFCSDGASMRALQQSVAGFEDKMTLSWRPGLGLAAPPPH